MDMVIVPVNTYSQRRYQKQCMLVQISSRDTTWVVSEQLLKNSKLDNLQGASKIKLKKVNKKRAVTVRRVNIFLNISRHPLLIWLHCCLHQYKTLKVVATATIVVLTPAKNLNKVFWGFPVVSPLFNNFLGYVYIYQRVIWPQKIDSKTFLAFQQSLSSSQKTSDFGRYWQILVKNRCRFTAGDLKAFFFFLLLISFTLTLATIFVSASFLPKVSKVKERGWKLNFGLRKW